MPEIISRGDVVDTIAAQVDLPQAQVNQVIRAFEDAIKRQAASGGEVRLTGFGSFKIAHRAARVSRNPQTGDPMDVAAHNALRFVPGKDLKQAAAASPQPQNAPKKSAKPAVAQADAAQAEAVQADAAEVAATPAAKTADKKDKKPVKKKK